VREQADRRPQDHHTGRRPESNRPGVSNSTICCCHAAYALSSRGFETIMVNCNPETVSTDYDTSDRLYFEPLTTEDVLEIVNVERSNGSLEGVIVQFGGQTPLKLARALVEEGVPILGTSADAIDLAEDRRRFQALLEELHLKQPRNATALTSEEAIASAQAVGYPLISGHPTYSVGAAWQLSPTNRSLDPFCNLASCFVSRATTPCSSTAFCSTRLKIDVDAVADDTGEVFIAGIMEHIEEAASIRAIPHAPSRRTL